VLNICESKRKGKDVIDLNEDSLNLWSGVDEYMQRSESVGLFMNERAKIW